MRRQRIEPSIRWHACLNCRLSNAKSRSGRSTPTRRCSQENLLQSECGELGVIRFDQWQYEGYQIDRAYHVECTHTRGARCDHGPVASRLRFFEELESQSAHRSKRYEDLAVGMRRSRRDRPGRRQELERSRIRGHRFWGTANTCFDVVEHRPDFKKVRTWDTEIDSTTPRLMASSATSRAVNREIGRCDSASGFSQAIDTIAACCSVLNREALPLRGRSANNCSICFFNSPSDSVHSTEINRCQSSRHRFRHTLTCCGFSSTSSPISSLLRRLNANNTILARCTNRTDAVREATIFSSNSYWR